MDFRGYYYFLNNTDSRLLEEVVLSLLRSSGIGIGLFFILDGQIRCNDFRVFGVKDGISYGFTILLKNIKWINKIFKNKVFKKELLVIPSDISGAEWGGDDRLIKARYFEDYQKLIKFIN